MMKRYFFLIFAGLMVLNSQLFGASADSGCNGKSDQAMTSSRWNARKPVVADGKIIRWEAAPDFMEWRKADPVTEGFTGDVLKVNLTGPFAEGAWSQHAGALFAISQEIPAGQTFVISFKARSLTGAKFLSVLRTWGGSKPWESIPITDQWRDYRVVLTVQSPTDSVTFSLVSKAGRLQPYCAGSFELAEVKIETETSPSGK